MVFPDQPSGEPHEKMSQSTPEKPFKDFIEIFMVFVYLSYPCPLSAGILLDFRSLRNLASADMKLSPAAIPRRMHRISSELRS